MCTSSSKAGKYAELLREDDDGNTRDVYGEREPVKPISLIGKERQTVKPSRSNAEGFERRRHECLQSQCSNPKLGYTSCFAKFLPSQRQQTLLEPPTSTAQFRIQGRVECPNIDRALLYFASTSGPATRMTRTSRP